MAQALSYVWWLSVNQDIELIPKGSERCQTNLNMPQYAYLRPWEWLSSPWKCVHIDLAIFHCGRHPFKMA